MGARRKALRCVAGECGVRGKVKVKVGWVVGGSSPRRSWKRKNACSSTLLNGKKKKKKE